MHADEVAAPESQAVSSPDALAPPSNRPLAVFCDFDGTFSVQDVGSTLAQQQLPERRARLWERFGQGEFTAWSYVLALFRGFELPEKQLCAFLETIDLDPGARDLLAWCEQREVPFRILSDGFDWNLERLQKIHDVAFAYSANHLEYDGDLWRLSPGAPNEACGCGTGSCKRSLIAAYRAGHPGVFCVHIGNGRVSDLCGALEADLAFAKDTLAPALDERGEAYVPFDTLHDVIAVLAAERE
jgi:2,3-diketo-5-methylthio-1-phosphopentane phosphatase